MKTYKTVSILVILFCSPLLVRAQATDLVQVADEMYKFGDIKDALEIYKQAVDLDSNHVNANFMVGKCYLETINKSKSLPYLLRAYKLDPTASENILLLIGQSYHLGYQFENAIEYYQLYKQKIENGFYNKEYVAEKRKEEIKKCERKIYECHIGMKLVQQPVNIIFENLGPAINSEYSDYAPVISADESAIFFTSRRKGSVGGNKDKDNDFFEDIYYSYRNNKTWNDALNIGTDINSKLHESCIGLSPDGKQLFIYMDNDKNKGDIFSCELKSNGKWSKPKKLGVMINTDQIENSITTSSNKKTIYFSSNKPGGKGGMDIYMCRQNAKNTWEDPVNISDNINTENDDESPFLSEDGKTLYFSSKGHEGMGGYDLFKSIYDSITGKWSTPTNLGYPINSSDDDFSFVTSLHDKIGYFASVKEGGFGDIDIYKFKMEDPAEISKISEVTLVKNEVEEKKSITVIIKIFDKEKLNPLDVSFNVLNAKNSEILLKGSSENGKVVYSNAFLSRELNFSISREGYVYQNINLSMQEGKYDTIYKTIYLSRINVGSVFILRNIYFDFDKWEIKKESNNELNNLLTFLKTNPKVKIQISGHTDSFGSASYNKMLSHKRSQEVKKWLVNHGVNLNRLKAIGHGEQIPIASNDDDDEGRELNRRIEVEVFHSGD